MIYERHGLTRIEVVFGVSLTILLLGMLVVGIGRVREEAKRIECQNNLKGLGLAVCNYRDCVIRLPLLTDQGEGAPTGRGIMSVFAQLWPYCEATWLGYHSNMADEHYNAPTSAEFRFDSKVEQRPYTFHGGMANQSLLRFLDPGDATADRLRDVPMTLPNGATGYYATSSYAANGLSPWGRKGDFAAFPRGMENTVMIGEKPQVCKTAAGELIYNLWGLGFYSPNMPAFATLTPAEPPGLLSTGQVAPVVPLRPRQPLSSDETIRVRVGRQDAPKETMIKLNPLQQIDVNQPCDPRLPGGPHAAGLQTLMADGSVRTFGWDTSPWIFWAACSPAVPVENQ